MGNFHPNKKIYRILSIFTETSEQMIQTITIATYMVYLLVSLYITVWVGHQIFKQGEHFLMEIFRDNTSIVKPVNRILLTGYYLINIGYVFVLLIHKQHLQTFTDVLELLSSKLGIVILSLGIIHLFNLMTFAFIYSNKLKNNNR